MKQRAPFQSADLAELDARLLSQARRVVPMRDVWLGDRDAQVIGLRHDVDDNLGSFETALRLAEWECQHGYSSTYFLLHDSHYWGDEMLAQVPALVDLGHEVGLHVNAIAEGLRQRQNPFRILETALAELRSTGVRIVGCVAHGDNACYDARFVNDELFTESARPDIGAPDRVLELNGTRLQLRPKSRLDFGLDYDPNWLPRGDYLSDSSGRWSQPFDGVCQRLGSEGQLHVLLHPDWWREAFVPETAVV